MKKSLLCFTLLLALMLAISPGAAALEPYYVSFSGQITAMEPYYNTDGSESTRQFVLTEDAEGGVMNFIVDENTIMLTGNELKIGAAITGYYLGNRPAIMIYPPQMYAELLVVDLPADQSVKAALFDTDLLSDDGQLKLNIGENTEITLQNGETAPVDIILGGRKLVVFYSVSTRSIPAQTTPERILVLDEAAEEETPPVAETPAAEKPVTDGMPLIVENVPLQNAPPVFIHESGAVMIPLRAVAEALGYAVGWQDGIVSLDGEAVLAIGQSTYTFDDLPIHLSVAAELRDSRTYVPLNFFREVLGLNNAYVLEGQVVIDNGEIMK